MKVTEQLKKAAREQIKQLIKERLDGIVDYGKNRVPIGHFNAFITMKDPSKAEQIAKWARGRMEMNKELGIKHQAMEVESVDSETGVVHLRGLAWTISNFLDSIDTSDAMYDGTVSHTRPTAEEPAEGELSEDTEANFTREQVKKVVEAALMAKKVVAEIDYPIQYGRVSRTFKPGEDVEIPWTDNQRIRGKVVDYNHRDGVYVVDVGRYQSETMAAHDVRSASRKVPFHDWQLEDRPSWAATSATKGNMEREELEAQSAALVANLESELETGFYSPEDNTPAEVVRDLVDAGELLAKDAEEAYHKLLSMPAWAEAAEREE